ncbi:hypothetical protein HII13_001839 [Brettanomyces bruxellensis]|nr:hypothetical protein HII13_001839 [Brettanomyces bruxellensis]
MDSGNDAKENGDKTIKESKETQSQSIIKNQNDVTDDKLKLENSGRGNFSGQSNRIVLIDDDQVGDNSKDLSKEKSCSQIEVLNIEDHDRLPSTNSSQEIKGKDADVDVIVKDDSDFTENDATFEHTSGSPKGNPHAVSISRGPYKLADLISNIKVQSADIQKSADTFITCVEAWDSNFYVGTSAGELIHMYKVGDCSGAESEADSQEKCGYIQLSRQKCADGKIRPIRKIILLSEIGKMLVLCGSTVSAYTLPELSPDSIGKVGGVSDITVDWDQVILDSKGRNYITKIDHIAGDVFVKVTLLTSKYIRLIRIFNDSIRLYKDVNYPDSIVGIQKSASTIVASPTNYDLVDMDHSQKVQLFSTSTPSDDEQTEDDPGYNHMTPIILPVGKDEFLLVCGGYTANDPAAGVIVNSSGDVTRGTITWMSYPTSVAVDYPYILATFSGGFIAVHSLHNQKLVQTIRFDGNISLKVKSVCRNFEIKDRNLVKALTRHSIKTQITPEEIEKTAIESDRAESNLSRSPSDGSDYIPMQLKHHSDQVFEELMDELKEATNGNHSTEWQFLVTLLVLFTMKFHKFDDTFNLLINNIKYVDPRLIIYIHAGKNYRQIFGSIWVSDGLLEFVDDLRNQYTSLTEQDNSREFIRLYANTCLASKESFEKVEIKAIAKTIEIYLLNIGLDQKEDLNSVLMSIHYSSTEVIETLLFKKSYFYLSRFYAYQENFQQCLYYWKGLITGDFYDENYMKHYKSVDESLTSLVEYMLQNCSQKETVVETYTNWLLGQFPDFGFKILIDKRVDNVEFNEVNVLHLLESKHSDLMIQYLEYIVNQKNKRQFIGDLTLAIWSEMLHLLDNNKVIDELTAMVSSYMALSIPKIMFSKFWNLRKEKSVQSEFVILHDKLYFYLSFITQATVSILNRVLVLNVCERDIRDQKIENILPLICLMIQFKGNQDEAVVDILCEIEDYNAADIYASTGELPYLSDETKIQKCEPCWVEKHEKSQKLLLILFDRYLHLKNPQLIDSFLNHHSLFENDIKGTPDDIFTVLDKFSGILRRIPDDFPLMEVQNFISRSLLKFQEYNNSLLISKVLVRSDDTIAKKIKKSL